MSLCVAPQEKALSGVKMLPDFSVPLCGLGQDNYRRLP